MSATNFTTTLITGANAIYSTESQSEKKHKSCKHRWGMWDMPMIVERFEPFNDHSERISPTLIQYRQCLECGEARARIVKY